MTAVCMSSAASLMLLYHLHSPFTPKLFSKGNVSYPRRCLWSEAICIERDVVDQISQGFIVRHYLKKQTSKTTASYQYIEQIVLLTNVGQPRVSLAAKKRKWA